MVVPNIDPVIIDRIFKYLLKISQLEAKVRNL